MRTRPNGPPRPTRELVELLYGELRDLAGRAMGEEREGHTLQATALVHEVYLRLSDHGADWQSQRHFLGAAAEAMRRILVDHARGRGRDKRGGGWERIPLERAGDVAGLGGSEDELDLEALDGALDELATFSPRKAEIVKVRYFVGLTIEETAREFDLSVATVKRDWEFARAWLFRRLGRGGGGGR